MVDQQPSPSKRKEYKLDKIIEEQEHEETPPKQNHYSTKDSLKYAQSQTLYTCQEVLQCVKNKKCSRYHLEFGTQSKSIFTRQGNKIVSRFNDSDDKENDMKLLKIIDLESKQEIQYHFDQRILTFSEIIEGYIYAITKDGSFWRCPVRSLSNKPAKFLQEAFKYDKLYINSQILSSEDSKRLFISLRIKGQSSQFLIANIDITEDPKLICKQVTQDKIDIYSFLHFQQRLAYSPKVKCLYFCNGPYVQSLDELDLTIRVNSAHNNQQCHSIQFDKQLQMLLCLFVKDRQVKFLDPLSLAVIRSCRLNGNICEIEQIKICNDIIFTTESRKLNAYNKDGGHLYKDSKHNFNLQINDCEDDEIGVMKYSNREINIISTRGLDQLQNKIFDQAPDFVSLCSNQNLLYLVYNNKKEILKYDLSTKMEIGSIYIPWDDYTKIKSIIQSKNYVAIQNHFILTDLGKKCLLNNGIYFFNKKSSNDVNLIRGDFGRILFDQENEMIFATDGNYIYKYNLSIYCKESQSHLINKTSIADLQMPFDRQMFYLQN